MKRTARDLNAEKITIKTVFVLNTTNNIDKYKKKNPYHLLFEYIKFYSWS